MNWKKIENNFVRNIWRKAEDDDCGEGLDSVEVSPDWYEQNGTPICCCGQGMVFDRTEIGSISEAPVNLPVLVLCKENVVHSAVLCADATELESRFADEFLGRGIEPCDADFDNGYGEFEDGMSACMTWVAKGDDLVSDKRMLQAQEADPDADQFQCAKCQGIFDNDDSVKIDDQLFCSFCVGEENSLFPIASF